MADRSVAVTLKASVAGYVGPIRQAASETDKFSKTSAKGLAEHNKQIEKVGKGALVAGGLIAVGIGAAVKSYMEFDKQMSNVQAVSNASASEMKALSEAALEAGARTKFSASEAAEATAELAKVGLGASDILGGALDGALDLAAAGNLKLADAAMYAGQTMKIFKLNGEDVPRIADALANGANKSAADVTDMAQALQQAGLMAAQTGLSMEDTVGTLALFADNALMGSDAGTSFKTMLQRLNPTTDAARGAMDELGLTFFDAEGNFVGIEESAGRLKASLKDLTVEQRQSALNTIFGSDAIRAATVLYDSGATGVRKYVDGVKEQGSAARLAAVQMDNLSGDIEQLSGAFETALIKAGTGANNMLRGIVQSVSSAVDWFSELPGPVQTGATALAAVSASGLLAAGTFITLVPKIAEARKALVALGGAGAVLTPLGIAFAAVSVGIGLFVKGQMDAQQRASEFRATLDQQTGALTENSRAFIANALQQREFTDEATGATFNVLDMAKALGVSTQAVVDASLGQADALSLIAQKAQAADAAYQDLAARAAAGESVDFDQLTRLQQTAQGFSTLRSVVGETTDEYGTQIDAQKQIADALGNTSDSSADAAQQTADLAVQHQKASAAANAQAQAIDDLRKAVKTYGAATNDVISTTIAYEAALDNASETVKKNGRNLKLTTEAGRSNMKSLLDLASAAKENAVQMNVSGKSIAQIRAFMTGKGGARDSFIAMAVSMGRSKRDAATLANQLGLTTANVNSLSGAVKAVPDRKTTKVSVPTAQAKGEIADIRANMATLRDRTIHVSVTSNVNSAVANIASRIGAIGGTVFRAGGGPVYGPGTSTSDSIPARLSDGEYVIKAAAVAKYGTTMFDQLNQMRFAEGGRVGAGRVPAASAAAPSMSGLSIVGTLETPFGPAQVRGVVQSELRDPNVAAAVVKRGSDRNGRVGRS